MRSGLATAPPPRRAMRPKGREVVFEFGIGGENGKNILVAAVQELDGMREGTILSAFVDFEIPDNCRKEDDGRFDEEVALLLHPRLIEVEHDGIGTLVSVGNILHEVGVYGVAAVAAPRIVEIDYIEFRFHLVSVRVVEQMIIGNRGQVAEFEIVNNKYTINVMESKLTFG